ncbi:hypothetical protein [Azospirillum sp. B506]|uniref:hypothetical protein n=1 Tax=Azospirillum sp. B506 TaxID=137721 RepID=UPI000A063837|nr:hypothetical protein [Azospirillum sp. B506]
MTDTSQTRTPSEGMPQAKTSGADRHDRTPAGERSAREDLTKTPGDGTLQDATPAGMSSKELRERAEDTDGSTQPGTG